MKPNDERWSSRSRAAISARARKAVSTDLGGTIARWLIMGPMIALVLIMVAVPPSWVMSSPPRPGREFVGSYSYEGPAGDPKQVVIDLDVSQGKGGKLTVGFGGGHADGSGAAPDGGGSGKIGGDGVLRFDYEDSFANRGAGTLRRTKNGEYRLSIAIKDVQESRCLMFYGEHVLKRSGKSAD